jgi:hypothetical protein
MHTIIHYPNDQRVEALALSVGRFTMRVVPRGAPDMVELKLINGQWTDENGASIEFESFFLQADMTGTLEMPEVLAVVS